MSPQRNKPRQILNLLQVTRERIERCKETTEAARRSIAVSKKLTDQARELVESLNRERQRVI